MPARDEAREVDERMLAVVVAIKEAKSLGFTLPEIRKLSLSFVGGHRRSAAVQGGRSPGSGSAEDLRIPAAIGSRVNSAANQVLRWIDTEVFRGRVRELKHRCTPFHFIGG